MMVLEKTQHIVMKGHDFPDPPVLSGLERRSSLRKLFGDVCDHCLVLIEAELQEAAQLVVGAAVDLDLYRNRHNLTLMAQH